MTVRLGATIREKPATFGGDPTGTPPRDIEAEGPTYDNAKAALDGQVPDGWQMLHVIRLEDA